jgi:hypothetical protein
MEHHEYENAREMNVDGTMPPWILSYCTSEFRSWDGETIG